MRMFFIFVFFFFFVRFVTDIDAFPDIFALFFCIPWSMTLTPVRENYNLNQDRLAFAVQGEKSILQFVER